jgi:hypothetical protein
MKKKFFILGLFLAAGFLFLNISAVKAETWTWTGAGDAHSWTDTKNWGLIGTSHGDLTKNFPGATTSATVVIGGAVRVVATTSVAIDSLTLGAANSGSVLTFAKGATLTASSTIIVNGISTLAFGNNDADTNVKGGALSLGSGNLSLHLGNDNAVPLMMASSTNFVAGTSTVTYAGSGRNIVVATTTYYNLSLTPTSTSAVAPSFIFGTASTCYIEYCTATTTIENVFRLATGTVAYFNEKAIVLSGGSALTTTTEAVDTPFYKQGHFYALASRVLYTSAYTGNIKVATGTYARLEIRGGGTKTLLGDATNGTTVATSTVIGLDTTLAVGNTLLTLTSATTTNSGILTMGDTGVLSAASSHFTNSGTLTLGESAVNLTSAIFANSGTVTIGATGVVTATSATWTNTGTITRTSGGKIVLAGAGVLSDSADGTVVTSFGNVDTLPLVHVQITDHSLNFTTSAETLTATVTSVSGVTTSQSVNLIETGASTGVFRGSIPFTLSGSAVSGSLAYQGSGTVSYTWTDSQDSDDTETNSASFTGVSPGGGSSGAAATTVTTTTTVTPTPTTVTTTATPAATTAATTVAAPTLESVSTKVASVVAKIAALPASPTASDLTSIQAEISAILVELQTLQAAQTTTGTALGFSFTKALTYGISNAEVTNLQEALKTDAAVYPEGKVTGYFGPATLKAVKAFQEKYGIATSGSAGYGRVGPATRAKLNELFGSH